VIGTAGLALGIARHAEAGWFVACFFILALLNAVSVPGTALLKEVSPTSAGAFAIGVSNGTTYVFVAIFSNAAGIVLDAFRASAVKTATATIYPAGAYQWMFVGMAAMSLVSLAASLFAPETCGVQRPETTVPAEGV
jgi:hypothetical protein